MNEKIVDATIKQPETKIKVLCFGSIDEAEKGLQEFLNSEECWCYYKVLQSESIWPDADFNHAWTITYTVFYQEF